MKSYLLNTVSLILLMITAFISCTTEEPNPLSRDSEAEVVKSVIHKSIGWAGDKDFKLLYSIIANDSDYLEVDPDSRVIRGFSEFKKNEIFWASPDFKAVSYDIRDLKIKLSETGDVAWFYCTLDDINEWKGKPACWMNTRWTGVLEKRNSKWIMVQQHFSFASGS